MAHHHTANTMCIATANQHNLQLVCGNYVRKAQQCYSELQSPSLQQPVHLMMVGYAETCSDNKDDTEY
jgi:hypothetical protein